MSLVRYTARLLPIAQVRHDGGRCVGHQQRAHGDNDDDVLFDVAVEAQCSVIEHRNGHTPRAQQRTRVSSRRPCPVSWLHPRQPSALSSRSPSVQAFMRQETRPTDTVYRLCIDNHTPTPLLSLTHAPCDHMRMS
jgi:hypothetical protein